TSRTRTPALQKGGRYGFSLSVLRMACLMRSPKFIPRARDIRSSDSSFGLGCDDSRMLIAGCVMPAFLASWFIEIPRRLRSSEKGRMPSAQIAALISASDPHDGHQFFALVVLYKRIYPPQPYVHQNP